MYSNRLTPEQRRTALAEMTTGDPLDILVVGGGITGAGIALDAVTRGLRTGVVEAQDWAGGTSAWSSKLVHGGLRYLYNLDFPLVAEALRERGLLMTTTAPHLVKAQPFLWPLKMPVIERSYSAIGVGMYDALALAGARGERTVPRQKHYSRKGALRLFPDIREDALVGAIRFYDARVDDARLVLDVVRTAVGYGALAASRTQVVDYLKDDDGRVVGAVIADLETGAYHPVHAKEVINATGVWTEETERLGGDGGLKVLASKGIHIVVPRERINGEAGIFLRTEKSVLFIIPWERYWVIGTTDTEWTEQKSHPVATSEDIDYVLDHANSVLAANLTRADIIGTYAGLRPLLQPGTKSGSEKGSTKISREHTITRVAPGLSAIAGGKLTTYRVMAEDAIDFVLGEEAAEANPSVTEEVPLVGAAGYRALVSQTATIAERYGWDETRVTRLLDRYGDEVPTLLAMIDAEPDLGQPLGAADAYLRAEVAFAATHEGALHLEDVLRRRVRLDYEMRDRGLAALPEIGAIVADHLGWSESRRTSEEQAYTAQAEAVHAAEAQATDAEASREVLRAPDLVPMR